MATIYIVRRPQRQALFLPLGGTRANPNTIIMLKGTEPSELDELVRGVCAKRGLNQDDVIAKAEAAYEQRCKTQEASMELHRRIKEQAEFVKLRWGGLRPPRKRG